jgi:flagellar hook protein FlgE
MGIPVDPTTGNLVGSVPTMLQFNSGFLPAQPTTQIQYQANLASYPLTTAHDTGIPGSELLNPASFGTDPTVAGNGTVVATDQDLFLKESISGGAITAYDVSGAPVNLQLRWAKVHSVANGGQDTWELFYQMNSNATGSQVAWQNAGVDYTFAANGQMSPQTPSIALNNVTVDGVSLGNIVVRHGTNGITQFADANGNVQVNALNRTAFRPARCSRYRSMTRAGSLGPIQTAAPSISRRSYSPTLMAPRD